MIRRWRFGNVTLSTFLLGLSVVTVSCGDFQDPAPASSAGVTPISEAEFRNLAQPSSTEQNGQTVPSTTPTSSAASGSLPPADTSRVVRTVTLSWDSSQDALGYKVHLIVASTSIQHIIDVGQGTVVYVPLEIGESYAFTVTAYNASGESPLPPFVYFNLS